MALVATPLYPVAGQEVTLSLTATAGTIHVFELTALPDNSALTAGLLLHDVATGERVKTSADDAAGLLADGSDGAVRVFTPDQAGEYTFTGYAFRDVVGIPSFPGDPSGDWRREFVDVQTGTVHVGAYVDLPIAASGHSATLRIQVNNETVRAATLVNPTTEVARVACLDSAVVAALATLVGVTVASLGTQLQAGANDLLTNYEAHRILVAGAVHADTDTTNVAGRDSAVSQEAAFDLLNFLRPIITAHAQVTGVGGGVGAPWHTDEDWKNVPVAGGAVDLASATVLMADLRERLYERHRVQVAAPASHGAADATNDLTAPLPLDNVIVALLDAIVATDPTAAAGEPEGATDAAHRYGFTRVED